MIVTEAINQQEWDDFISSQQFSPFLQSWTMGEVYRDVGEEPIRLEVRNNNGIVGICLALVIPARRGRHIAVMYGPIITNEDVLPPLLNELKKIAVEQNCSFIRLAPFWPKENAPSVPSKPAPLHLLAEHIWHLSLQGRSEEEILKQMRKNTRNLIRRAEREGVTIERSANPLHDLDAFITLHEETRKRHKFVPYTNDFFRAQVEHFHKRNECTLYLAHYNNEVIASSIHMHMFGETSYHHGASTHKYPKIPASYLLQWTAVKDALARGDSIYSFWGIAPKGAKNHPFQGVTTFKTGFGGELLELTHCMDIPVSKSYYATRAFEYARKWRRGF